MKRIVLCFDGTWNTPADEAVAPDRRIETNVRRFFQSVADSGPDGVHQTPWYNEGVGTAVLNRLAGGAFGLGLDQHIIAGYQHLAETYESGDEVFILGFSRGAYTARSLVGMIRNCGLVHASLAGVQTRVAFGIYRTREDGPDSLAARTFRSLFARPIPIRFLGVWDTVGALGIPLEAAERLAMLGAVDSTLYRFHDTRLSSIVDRAYQAIALDEHRASYAASLWDPAADPGQTLEQRWFSGAHADVGGGYQDRRLSDLTLRWMQDRAAEAGLALAPVPTDEADGLGEVTDSYAQFLHGVYAEHNPRHRRVVLGTRYGNEVIDPTVERRRTNPTLGYDPLNPGLPPLPVAVAVAV